MSSLKTKRFSRCHIGLFFVLIIASMGTMAADLGAEAIPTILIKERVEIVGAEVLLGEVATIEGGDVQFRQHLMNIVIGKAPLPGNSRQFDRQYLQMRLKQYHVDLETVLLKAPPQVEVIRRHVEIQKHEIEKIVSEFIYQHTASEKRTVRIKSIRIPANVILPTGHITYKVTAPRSRQLMGRCPIAVDFSINGQLQKKVWATALIEVLGLVVVTRKPLGRYQPITEDDVEVQTLDLANLPANVLSDPNAAIGKRTKRAQGSQTPLRADSIELPPLVKRGDLVVIIAQSKSLTITTLGQVKKKGRLGERIPVVNLDSKKILHARVRDANTVQVDF